MDRNAKAGLDEALGRLVSSASIRKAAELAQRGRYEEGICELQAAREYEGPDVYHDLLGRIHAQQGDYEHAISEWNEALKSSPDDAAIIGRLQKARMLEQQGHIIHSRRWKGISGGLLLITIAAVSLSVYLANKMGSVEDAYLVLKQQVEQHESADMSGDLNVAGSVDEINKKREYSSAEESGGADWLRAATARQQRIVAEVEEIRREINGLGAVLQASVTVTVDVGRQILRLQGLTGSRLHVALEEEHLRISGSVPTEYLKVLIEEAVKEVEHIESVDASGLEVTYEYRVRPNETLGGIAERLYGDSRAWTHIYHENKSNIKDPDRILPDLVIRTP
ncbi:MAG: tetratricopeptide repeat protein [Candidatus Thiodiazotropha sp. (ex Lucinoma borealis)]|nr:tetratricopeptide repeat protein [Candidatus Thiodiazotropha sp. (ex Lucinoma borealis)]